MKHANKSMGLSPEFELVDDIVVNIAAKEEKHGCTGRE